MTSTELEDDWQEVEGSTTPLSASSVSGQALVVKDEEDEDDEVASRHLEEQIREQLTSLNERRDAALASHLPWNDAAVIDDSTSSVTVADRVALPTYPSSYAQPLPSVVQLSEDYASESFVSSAAVHPNSERATVHDEFVEQCDEENEEDIVEDSPTRGDGLLSSLSTVGSSSSVNVDVHFTSSLLHVNDDDEVEAEAENQATYPTTDISIQQQQQQQQRQHQQQPLDMDVYHHPLEASHVALQVVFVALLGMVIHSLWCSPEKNVIL